MTGSGRRRSGAGAARASRGAPRGAVPLGLGRRSRRRRAAAASGRPRGRGPAARSRRAPGDSTPAPAQPVGRDRRRACRRAACPPEGFDCVEGSHAAREVGLEARVDDRLQVAVEHLVEVVGLVAGAVVGDAVLRVVVGADPLGAVDRADLAAAGLAGGGVRLAPGRPPSSRARRMRSACSLFCSWLFSFWQLTTMPVGTWVIRTAESVVLTLWPPGPLLRNTSMRRSCSSIWTSIVLRLGHHQDAGRAGVDAALRLGHRHPLHAVDAALELQQPVRRVARLDRAPGLHRDRDRLVAAQVGLGGVEHLGRPRHASRRTGCTCGAGRRRTGPTPRRPRPT